MDTRWNFGDERKKKKTSASPLQSATRKRKTAFELEQCSYEIYKCDPLPSHLLKQFTSLRRYGYDDFIQQFYSSNRESLAKFTDRCSVQYNDIPFMPYFFGEIFAVKQFFINIYGWQFDHYWIVENTQGIVGLLYCANLRLLGGKQMLRGERMLCKSILTSGRNLQNELEFMPFSDLSASKQDGIKLADEISNELCCNTNSMMRKGTNSCDFQEEDQCTSSSEGLGYVSPRATKFRDLLKNEQVFSGDDQHNYSLQFNSMAILSTPFCPSGALFQDDVIISGGEQEIPEINGYTKTLPPCIDNFKLDLYRVRIKYYGSRVQKHGVLYSCGLFNSYERAVHSGSVIRDTLEYLGVKAYKRLTKIYLEEGSTDEILKEIALKKASMVKTSAFKFRRNLTNLYPMHTPQSTLCSDREALIMLGKKLKYSLVNFSKKSGHLLETRKKLQQELILLCKRTQSQNATDLRTVLLFSHRVPETHDVVSSLLQSLIDVEGEHFLYKIGSQLSTVSLFYQIMYRNKLNTDRKTLYHSFFDYLWFVNSSVLVE
jgi:hypothetical protein